MSRYLRPILALHTSFIWDSFEATVIAFLGLIVKRQCPDVNVFFRGFCDRFAGSTLNLHISVHLFDIKMFFVVESTARFSTFLQKNFKFFRYMDFGKNFCVYPSRGTFESYIVVAPQSDQLVVLMRSYSCNIMCVRVHPSKNAADNLSEIYCFCLQSALQF